MFLILYFLALLVAFKKHTEQTSECIFHGVGYGLNRIYQLLLSLFLTGCLFLCTTERAM